jgi:hypothetical protein
MTRFTTAAVFALTALCGCAHLASSRAIFTGSANAGDGPLVLRITRHMEEIVHGPDIDEDQLLVLELRDFELNKKLAIPSEKVTLGFSVTRFGPSSKDVTSKGYIIVRSVSDKKVVSHLHLDIVARTSDGSYTQQVKFHGDYTFDRESDHD